MRINSKLITINKLLYLLFIIVSTNVIAQEQNNTQPIYFDHSKANGSLSGSLSTIKIDPGMSTVYDISGKASIVVDNGKSTNRVDIVVIGDGYQASELTKFSNQVNTYASGIMLQEPFLAYSNYFNIHRIDIESVDSGISNDISQTDTKNTPLNSQFWCQGNQTTLCTDVTKAWNYAALARDFDHILVLVNSSSTGSAAYPFSDLSVVSALQAQNIDSAIHQLGHSFGNLADEYDVGPWPTYTGFEPAEFNVSAQNTAAMTLQNIKWIKWLGNTAFGSEVGTFEGAMGYEKGIYRPTITSKMRELNAPFNGPSIESIIKEIYRKVKVIDDATPNSSGLSGQNTFFVKPMKNGTQPLKIQWYMDGNPINSATLETFRPNDVSFTNGPHTLSVKVVDNTTWLKDEVFRAKFMTDERAWTININQNAPQISQHPSSITKYPNDTATFSVKVSGEDIKYQWFRNGNPIPNATTDSITVTPVQRSNSNDQYWVEVKNVAGLVKSNTAVLTVANRAPFYSGPETLNTFRDSSVGFTFSINDLDNDIVETSVTLDSVGINSGATAIISNNQLDIKSGRNYLGDFYANISITDKISTINIPIKISVKNQYPLLAQIQNQSIDWQTDYLDIPLVGSDPDSMDTLTFSANLEASEIANITASIINNNVLRINPKSGYVGQFIVTARASDGLAYTERQFIVAWSNAAPVISPIADQSMFYKKDYISVAIPASDPNNDSLTLSAKVVGGSTNLNLQISGTDLIINPPSLSKTSSIIEIKAFDGKLSTTRTFYFTSYNNAPTISTILTQRVSPQKSSIKIPVTISDPDSEDTVTSSASLVGFYSQNINVSIENNNTITVTSDRAFTSQMQIKVEASDGDLNTQQLFNIIVNNTSPSIGNIPDQYIQPKVEDSRVIEIPGIDPDNDDLTYSAKLIGFNLDKLGTFTVSGNKLTINPIDSYLGSYSILVTATDGVASVSQNINVTNYNNEPDLAPICDRLIGSNDSISIPLSTKDADKENIKYSVSIESSDIAKRINKKYNFAAVTGSRSYNVFGYKEKYLTGTFNNTPNTLFFITPNGNLYRAGESFQASSFIEQIHPVFYVDPNLLITNNSSSNINNLTTEIKDSNLLIKSNSNFIGLAVVRVKAYDGFTFDEESFILGSSTDSYRMSDIPDIRSHWKEDITEVTLPPLADPTNSYVVGLNSSDIAFNLDKTYMFEGLLSDGDLFFMNESIPQDNQENRQEKYFIGHNPSVLVFGLPQKTAIAIVPDGTLYACKQITKTVKNIIYPFYTISQSTKIGKVDPIYYNNLPLLIDPPSSKEPNIKINLVGNKLYIDTADGFLGKNILEISTKNNPNEIKLVMFDKYNNIPKANSVDQSIHSWRTKNIELPYSTTEYDNQDQDTITSSLTIEGSMPYSHLDKYNLTADSPINARYNNDGWREMHLKGTYNNTNTEYALLPTGGLYANWNGSPQTSTLVTYVNVEAYKNTNLLNGTQWQTDWIIYTALKDTIATIVGNSLKIKIPDSFRAHNDSVRVVQHVFDGLSMGEKSTQIGLLDGDPQFAPIGNFSLHWRTSSLTIPFSIVDSDGQDDLLNEISVINYPTRFDGAPGKLSFNGTLSAMNISLIPGKPNSYYIIFHAKDQVNGTGTISTNLDVYNNPPSLTKIGAQKFNYNTNSKIILSADDPDSADKPKLKYFVYPGNFGDYAGNIAEKYKLKLKNPRIFNTLASDEEHLIGEYNGKVQEFVIFNTGALYAWNGNLDNSELVEVVHTYYANGNTLVNAKANSFSTATASLNNNELSFSRNGAAVSPSYHRFTVCVSDGYDNACEMIPVEWIDNPPVLPESGTKSGHWRNGALEMSGFPANDVDGDPITYTFSQNNIPGTKVSIANNSLKVIPAPNNSYIQLVSIQATSTNKTVSGYYSFNFTDDAPVIQNLPSLNAGYKETVNANIAVIDPNDDPITLSATLSGTNASGYKATVVGKTVTITPVNPAPGTLTVNVVASDGPKSTSGQFNITFVNRAPTITPLQSVSMKWSEKTRVLPVTVSDPDGDTINFVTSVTPAGVASASVANNNLTVNLLGYAPNFNVQVTAKDQVNKADANLTVLVTNTPPVISGLASTKSVHWTESSISLPFSVVDSDGDKLTLDSKSLDSTFPATTSISGSNLVISLPQKKVGKFSVELGASDGVIRTKSTVAIDVNNQAPKFAELSNIIIPGGIDSRSVTLDATDPDGDPLTFTAKLLTPAQVAYEINQIHHFFVGSLNYNYNKLGNGEKYLKGRRTNDTSDKDYVIFPNGRMYLWTGTFSTSTYIGTVPSDYYIDPGKLVNAPASNSTVADLTASVSNNVLTLTPSNSFTGTAWAYASATDTRDTSGIFFSITLDAATDVNDPGQCKNSSEAYDGDYESKGKGLFHAEGCLGDNSNSGNGKSELKIGDSGNSSYKSGEESHYSWTSGKKVNFSLTYDPDTKVANFTFDGKSVSHSISTPITLSDCIIKAKRDSKSSSVYISDLKLNGAALNNSLAVSDSTSQIKTLKIRAGYNFTKKFTLEGSAQITYSNGAKDSEVSLSFDFVRSDDAPSSCSSNGDGSDDDDDDDDDNSSAKKIKICHIPAGDITKAKTISISKNALEAHLKHGDVVGECPGQPVDPGDPANGGPSCEQKQIFSSPNYTLWNSFLNMGNILELTNGTSKDIPVKVTLYSINGEVFDQRTVNVAAHNQFDIIVNDMKNFVKDSYGIIKLEFEGNIDGRMSYYRPSQDGAGYDFAYSIPLLDATFGNTAAGFNTFQPSTKLEESRNLVANWLSIVNLDSEARVFTIFTYNSTGALILRREIEVPSFGRADVDGGHGVAGPNVVGYHKIVPNNITSEYIAQLTRYGGDAPAGFAPSKFKFAVPLSSKLGQSDPIYMPISNKFGQANWIEVVNILDKTVGASINYYSQGGRLLESVDAQIEPNAQRHFNASASLPTGETGYAVVVPYEPFSIVAQSMGYLKEPGSGSITSVYGSQARRALPCAQSGSYNLFLNMQNWLLVSNTTNDPVDATLLFSGPNSATEKSIVLPPRASTYIQIHQNAELKTSPNTYGLIAVYPKDPSIRLFSEVLRLRYRANGNPDFSMPIPVR